MPHKLGATGQRSHVAIMFTDLSDSTLIASKIEPEHYSDILDQMRDRFVSIVKQHGGEVIRIDGDGFIFIFGYPIFYEDNSRRAAEAALDIHECLEDIEKEHSIQNIRLRMHTGIHSGIVLIKHGDIARGKYEILGDPTNITARLCDFAAPGEIVISNETLGRTSQYFQIAQQALVSLAGRKERLLVKKIIGRNTTGDDENIWASHSVHFIGRKHELKWLKNFAQTDNNFTSIAHLQAEAGMGKSRLIHEFSNQMLESGFNIHHGICESYLGMKPYQPIEQLITSVLTSEFSYSRKVLDKTPEDTPQSIKDMIKIIISKRSSNESVEYSSQDFADAFLRLCELIPQKSVILVVDDWQWVDDASKDIIETIVKSNSRKIRVIVASRVQDSIFVEMNGAESLRLKPLTSPSAYKTIQTLIPGVEPFTMQRIETHSGGNPLYIEELCYAIRDQRFNFDVKRTDSWINALIYARFEQLPNNLAQIVKIAAVIGHIVPEWLLNEISEEAIGTRELVVLRQSDFLYPAERRNHLRFKHGITRDVIYDMINLKDRQQLHNRIIESLTKQSEACEESTPHDELAYHFRQAGKASISLHHSRIAGETALKDFSLDRAQRHFKNALEQADKARISKDDKLSLLRNYGLSCVVDPSKDQTPILEAAVKSARMTGDMSHLTWSEYWLGFNLYGLGYPKRSINHFNQSLKACHKINDNKLETQLFANLGQAYAAAGEYSRAYQYLDKAINIKMQKRSGQKSSAGLAYAISCKGFALGEQGHFNDAMECFSKAIDVLAGTEHSASTSILNQKAVVNLWHNKLDEALNLSHQTFELSRRMHSRYNFAQSVFITAAVRFKKTNDIHHIDKMIEAVNWLIYDGTGQNMSLNYGALLEVLTDVNDWDRARIFAARGLSRIRAGDRRCESQIFRSLALISKAGKSARSSNYYMNKASASAESRQSIREMKNNEMFEQAHFH
jgi:class 3 adenylate cyclase/tetratricopeptide (TPR) repeat protein